MQEEFTNLVDAANLFQALGQACELRANDPEAFVRLAYIVKSILDRHLGTGNRHSAALAELCELTDMQDAMPASREVAARYLQAAQILRAGAREILGDQAP